MLASLEQDSLFKYFELKLIASAYDIHLINKNAFEKMLTDLSVLKNLPGFRSKTNFRQTKSALSNLRAVNLLVSSWKVSDMEGTPRSASDKSSNF